MAVEGVMIREGTYVAGANFSNTAGLAGPGGSGQFLAVKQSTAADRTVLLGNTAGTIDILGILQNKPVSGDAADICILGTTKAVYGGTVVAGAFLTTDASGRLVTATTGQLACAKAVTAGVIGDVQTVEMLPARVIAP